MKKDMRRWERAGVMISLALFLLIFFTWIILLMLYSYNRWCKGQEMKMLRTKYISPTFRNMRYKVWMINDVIKSKGELIWGDEKFSPFFEFPIQLPSMPAPFNRPISLNSNNQYERVKIIVREPSNPNPDVLLYKNDVEYDRLSVIRSNPEDFDGFQEAVRKQLSVGLVEQVRSEIPIENGRLVENGEIKERSYEGIVEKIRGVTYPLVKRLIGYGVIEEVYEVRIRDREMMIENRKYIYHRVRMTPVFKVPREINNKAYRIIDDTDVSFTIVYKINYVVNIDAQYEEPQFQNPRVRVEVKGNPALELKRVGYGE
jgi:hypothetical protein